MQPSRPTLRVSGEVPALDATSGPVAFDPASLDRPACERRQAIPVIDVAARDLVRDASRALARLLAEVTRHQPGVPILSVATSTAGVHVHIDAELDTAAVDRLMALAEMVTDAARY